MQSSQDESFGIWKTLALGNCIKMVHPSYFVSVFVTDIMQGEWHTSVMLPESKFLQIQGGGGWGGFQILFI